MSEPRRPMQPCNPTPHPAAVRWIKLHAEAEAEVNLLRARVRELEDLTRWRKWPEETPPGDDIYQVLFDEDSSGLGFDPDHIAYDYEHGQWEWSKDPIYWRPIGPMPQEVRDGKARDISDVLR